jgi:hypothetical protein
MTVPKFNLPVTKVEKSSKMANRFVGIKLAKKVKFMGEDLDIHKLSVAQVVTIQGLAKEFEDSADPLGNLKLLAVVIKSGANELADLSEEDMNNFPIDELSKLSEEIMKHSGLAALK